MNTSSASSLLESLSEMGPIDLTLHSTVEDIVAGDDEADTSETPALSAAHWTCECRVVKAERPSQKCDHSRVRLIRQEFFGLLESLHKLSNVRHLRLSSDGPEIPLARVVSARSFPLWSQRLETFQVTRGLCLHQSHVEILVEFFTAHPSLRSVCLYDVILPASYDQTFLPRDSKRLKLGAFLDPLFLAMATIPNLECVDCSVSNLPATPCHQALVSPQALRVLFETPPLLEEVSLWNWGINDTHIKAAMIPALAPHHKNLRFLSLRQNPAITAAGWDTFYKSVLEDGNNYTLLHVVSDCGSTTRQQARGCNFLKLNQQGRGSWLSMANANPQMWCDVLARFTHDLDDLYYWIQQAAPLLIVR